MFVETIEFVDSVCSFFEASQKRDLSDVILDRLPRVVIMGFGQIWLAEPNPKSKSAKGSRIQRESSHTD